MNLSASELVHGAIAYAVPLWLAGIGELIGQCAGVVNIGIEGMMLTGALAAWAVSMATGSLWMGLVAAGLAGMLLAGLFAIVTLVFEADQIVAGTALNLIAVGATGLGFKVCLERGLTQSRLQFFSPWDPAWLPPPLHQYGLCWLTLALLMIAWIIIRHTRWGIELTALGEHPAAAHAVGIRVNLRRAACVLFGGLTAGLAGSYLSVMFNTQFNPNMTAGRGFLALAMVVFGRWHPAGLLVGGVFFGAVYWAGKTLEISAAGNAAASLLEMLPYVLSLIVLAGFMGKTRAPAALGQSFTPQ